MSSREEDKYSVSDGTGVVWWFITFQRLSEGEQGDLSQGIN